MFHYTDTSEHRLLTFIKVVVAEITTINLLLCLYFLADVLYIFLLYLLFANFVHIVLVRTFHLTIEEERGASH